MKRVGNSLRIEYGSTLKGTLRHAYGDSFDIQWDDKRVRRTAVTFTGNSQQPTHAELDVAGFEPAVLQRVN